MRDVFEEDDDYESNSPVLLSVPQLEGPIAFTKEALKNWASFKTFLRRPTRTHDSLKNMWYRMRSHRTTYMPFTTRLNIWLSKCERHLMGLID